jgi:hypothetical protein
MMAVTGLNKPDFRTISTFRRRHLVALRGLFVQVLRLCQTAGLVKLGHVAVDGTNSKPPSEATWLENALSGAWCFAIWDQGNPLPLDRTDRRGQVLAARHERAQKPYTLSSIERSKNGSDRRASGTRPRPSSPSYSAIGSWSDDRKRPRAQSY